MGSRLESKSAQVRKRIESHAFDNEEGDEYEGSKFGGFPEYFRRKKIKLQNLDAELRAKAGDNPPIFKGVVAHVNGYTQPSLNDLHTMIVSHGGGFLQYLDGKTMVTHIIASNLTPKKVVEFRRYRVVKPAWVVDSINVGKLLPWDSYRVVDEGVGQKVLGYDNGQVTTQASKQKRGYKEQTETSWYTSQLRGQPSSQPRSKAFPFTQTLTPDDDINDSDSEALAEDIEKPKAVATKISDAPVNAQFSPSPEKTASGDNAESTLGTPPKTSPAESKLQVSPTLVARTSHLPFGRPDHWDSDGDEPRGVKRSISPSRAAKMTAEEHNAILLADPRIRKSTVVDPNFLEQYYRESRLHHLSTWKADLKSQLQAMTAEKSLSQKANQKGNQYKDKPCVVAHGGGTGSEIASCNYPARKFGISNGMWMKRAQDLCPELKVLPYDFPAYEETSRKFYDAILATGGIVQSVSVDEALIDISAQCIATGGSDGVRRNEGAQYREQAKADEIGQELRARVLEVTGCNVSVGIGANILQAKVALRKAKPAGQFQLKPEEVLGFVGNLEVQSLPGVAYSIGGKLEGVGIRYVKDIRDFSREKLINTLGPKTGDKMWEYARGIDRTEVGDQVVRKSVSSEVNWGVRFENQEQVDEFIESLCGELHKRLLKGKVKGRQLTMKVMRRSPDAPLDPPKHLGHGKCDTYNKSLQLGIATNDPAIITKEALATMRGFGFTPGELRGIGIQMTKLEPFKGGTDGKPESSQQRLQFKMGEPSRPKPEQTEDPIHDDIETPKKRPRLRDIDDRPVAPPSNLFNTNSPSRKPLNILGTQFALPTQVDPKVLAELPSDIRAKLTRHVRPAAVPELAPVEQKDPSNPFTRAQSVTLALPSESQLDHDTLNSLPPDIRDEVLAFYSKPPLSPRKPGAAREQSLLPQSPRKNRLLPAGVTKKPRAADLSNFILARARDRQSSHEPITASERAEDDAQLDPEFLAALPEDLRREVLAQARLARLQRTSNLSVPPRAHKSRPRELPKGQETLERSFLLPPRKPQPTFTVQKLSEIGDLREAISDWVREFGTEGPYGEDVEALGKYLGAVVREERDLSKAVRVCKWLGWVVERMEEEKGDGDGDGGGTGGTSIAKEKWVEVAEGVKEAVKEAVRQRGLAEVDLG
ncbi:deoxycytidyl transferase [Taxawa tesnikishii (nom. ined.)]|nr:deoxycytidyl transferase [Dothideales sp. JES 119]